MTALVYCNGGTELHADLGDGRAAHLAPLIPAQWRIMLGRGCQVYDEYWDLSEDVEFGTALVALLCWRGDGDPPVRWNRHMSARGMRRRRFGDPSTEWTEARG